jgi:hypothetical protein
MGDRVITVKKWRRNCPIACKEYLYNLNIAEMYLIVDLDESC